MQNFSLQETGADRSNRLSQLADRARQAAGKVPLKRWQALVMLLIVVWLAHSLAQLFWIVAPSPAIRPAQVGAGTVTTAGTGDSKNDIDIGRLRELSVFGSSEAGSDPEAAAASLRPLEPQIEDQAVDTKLSLVLQGVINSSDARAARAIISDGQNQETYGPGDEIKNMRGVKVAKVLDLRVILDNKGQYESLWLYKDEPDNRRTAARNRTAPVINTPGRSWEGNEEELNEGSDTNDTGPVARDTPQAKVIGKNVSLEQLGQNLADVVAFNIHRGPDGQIQGYKVRPGRNPAAFEAAGLQAGDIVTAVNGTPLDNPGRIMEIYRNLGQATSASLDVERNGDTVTIDIELE